MEIKTYNQKKVRPTQGKHTEHRVNSEESHKHIILEVFLEDAVKALEVIGKVAQHMLLADQEIDTNQDPLIIILGKEVDEISHEDEENKWQEWSILFASEETPIDDSKIYLASVGYSSPFTGLSVYAENFVKSLERSTVRVWTGLENIFGILKDGIKVSRGKMLGFSGTG